MARETKAERLAREAKARAAEEQALKASYPERLMAALERATKYNYVLLVRNGAFELTNHDDSSDGTYDLSMEFDIDSEEALAELVWRLDTREKAEREARRRNEIRKAALCKLSAEEKDVLGL